MNSDLRTSLNLLEDLGFINVLLPFLFVFVVVYGILEKTRVFGLENGKTKKNINSLFAFIIAFIFISFTSQVNSMITFLQIMAMVLIFLMGISYIFAVFKFDQGILTKKGLYMIFSFVFVILAFTYSLGLLSGSEYDFILDLIFNPVVIMIIFFFGLIWFITGSSEKNGISSFDKNNPLKDSSFENIPHRDVLNPKWSGQNSNNKNRSNNKGKNSDNNDAYNTR